MLWFRYMYTIVDGPHQIEDDENNNGHLSSEVMRTVYVFLTLWEEKVAFHRRLNMTASTTLSPHAKLMDWKFCVNICLAVYITHYSNSIERNEIEMKGIPKTLLSRISGLSALPIEIK